MPPLGAGMGFDSFQFILMFLPACYAGFILVHRFLGWNGVYAYLALASLVFYGFFSPVLAAILMVSVLFNYLAGTAIRLRRQQEKNAGFMACAAIAANVAALAYFKYTNFFIDIINSVSGAGHGHLDLLIPVGVSFFTFTQIGFLIDALKGQTHRVGLGKYALFATFFPCVTAGPLLNQRDMFAQMKQRTDRAFNMTALSVGLTMFGIGLFKTVVLAGAIAPYANLVFDGVALGAAIAPMEAWIGALCYSLQIYFDLSGYADMAVGLGFIFGIKLPLNFNSPFKATSISDFWRRWHMSMMRFFTTYVFSPLAMRNTRKVMSADYSSLRRWLTAMALPVIVTFLVVGIWHGAGYTFILFGLLHGVALAVDSGWKHFKLPSPGRVAGWFMTMAVVVSSLVLLRAPTLDAASAMLSGMWGMAGFAGGFAAVNIIHIDVQLASVAIAVLGAIVLCAPNSQQILRAAWISSDPQPEEKKFRSHILRWKPNAVWAVAAAVLLVISFTSLGGDAGFLNYRF